MCVYACVCLSISVCVCVCVRVRVRVRVCPNTQVNCVHGDRDACLEDENKRKSHGTVSSNDCILYLLRIGLNGWSFLQKNIAKTRTVAIDTNLATTSVYCGKPQVFLWDSTETEGEGGCLFVPFIFKSENHVRLSMCTGHVSITLLFT